MAINFIDKRLVINGQRAAAVGNYNRLTQSVIESIQVDLKNASKVAYIKNVISSAVSSLNQSDISEIIYWLESAGYTVEKLYYDEQEASFLTEILNLFRKKSDAPRRLHSIKISWLN